MNETEKPVRLQLVLCATPSCSNRVAMSQTTLGPVYCQTCLQRQQQRPEE